MQVKQDKFASPNHVLFLSKKHNNLYVHFHEKLKFKKPIMIFIETFGQCQIQKEYISIDSRLYLKTIPY